MSSTLLRLVQSSIDKQSIQNSENNLHCISTVELMKSNYLFKGQNNRIVSMSSREKFWGIRSGTEILDAGSSYNMAHFI